MGISKRSIAWSLLLGLFLAVVFLRPATAHVQAGDARVTAVLHVVPDDRPIASRPTIARFSFGGSTQAFSIVTCGCQVTVRSGTQTVSTVALEPVDADVDRGQASVTFPDAGVYDLELTGQAEEAFRMSFTVRVDDSRQSGRAASGIDIVLLSATSLVIVGVLAYYNISNGMRYTTPIVSTKRRKTK